MRLRLTTFLFVTLLLITLAPSAIAGAGIELTAADDLVLEAAGAAERGDIEGAKAGYEQFRTRWLEIEDGVKAQSRTAYKSIEDEMSTVQFVLVSSQPDASKLQAALRRLSAANQKFVAGGYPADGGTAGATNPTGNVASLLSLLDRARERIDAGDAAGAAKAMDQFRKSWLDVEGVVLTQSAKIYADSERDMVSAYALLSSASPDLVRARSIVTNMHGYLAPVAAKSGYTMFDATTVLLREGLEALLVIVALLAVLGKSGHGDKTVWVWGGVTGGLVLSAGLALAVKLLFGTSAFGSNNFLIAGWTGLFGAAMLIWVSYWLHSKSQVAEWQRYIHEQSAKALATGNLVSLATLSFVAVLREGTETVLFFVGMASSISMRDMVAGLGIGFGVLAIVALVILKLGGRIPVRPFFQISSILVFYLGFKFTGNGIHGLQLAGLLPATVVPYLPNIDFLSVYPNWESTLPQLLLLLAAAALPLWNLRRSRSHPINQV